MSNPIYITGLPHTANFLAGLFREFSSHLEPELILQNQKKIEVDGTLIVCYTPPWEFMEEIGADSTNARETRGENILKTWSNYYSRLLRNIPDSSAKIFFINVARLEYHQLPILLAELGIPTSDGYSELPLPKRVQPAVATVRGFIVSVAFPEVWDLYEAMEMRAYLMNRESEYRASFPLIVESDLPILIDDWLALSKLSGLEARTTELTGQLDRARSELDETKNALATSVTEIQLLNRQVAELESQLEHRSEELAGTHLEIGRITTVFQESIAAITIENERTSEALRQCQEFQRAAVVKAEEDKILCARALSTIETQEQQLDELRMKISILNTQIELLTEARDSVATLQVTAKQKEGELARLSAEVATLQAESTQYHSHLKSMESQMKAERVETEHLLVQLQDVQIERARVLKDNEELRELLSEAISASKKARSVIENLAHLDID